MFTLCQKILVFLVFLKSVNRSGAFFDFCVHIHKIVQSYFSSQSFSRSIQKSFSRSVVQSFSRSVAQSFNHIYTHIVEMGYFVAHSTWRYRVLGDTRYCVTQGTIWRRVLCGARYYMAQGWQFFLIPSDAKQRTNIHKKADQTNKAKKK